MSRRPLVLALLALVGAGALLAPHLARPSRGDPTRDLVDTAAARPIGTDTTAAIPTPPPAPPATTPAPSTPRSAATAHAADRPAHPSDDPAYFFGVTGPVSIHEIPAGPFLDSLLALSAEDRATALARLGDARVPRSQLTTLRATPHGGLLHICPPGPHDHHPGHVHATPPPAATTTSEAASPVPLAAKVPISHPPALNSRQGASRVLYLDFNGHTVTGTHWNTLYGRSAFYARPFDIDGDFTTFSDAEQAIIREVWARVAEDFAPFDINVTTVEPSSFTPTTGRVLITLAEDANGNTVPGGTAGGVAYLNMFGESDYATKWSPAWAIADNVGATNAANIAEVVSHEFGHNLGLNHDGTSTSEYYAGHGTGATSWGPIMGASYGRNVTTFSKGEYRNANNTQEDDLAIIATKIPYRADDVADTPGSAPSLGGVGTITSGLIERSTDADRYRVTTGTGRIILSVRAFTAASGTRGNNLDIRAEIYGEASSTTPLATFDPADGPDIDIDATFTPGTYYLRILSSGVGNPYASPPVGYTAYGSLGTYTITNNTSPVPPPAILVQPTGGARPLGAGHTFTVVADGTATGYQWRFNGQNISGATGTSFTLADLTFASAGSYDCAVSNSSATAYTVAAKLGVYRDTPDSITINPNSSTTFPTLVAGAFENFAWSHNSAPLVPLADPRILISGPVLRINNVAVSDAGAYTLATTFGGTPVYPGAVTVTVRPPVVLAVPSVVNAYRGETPVVPIDSSHHNLTFRYVGLPSGIGYSPATGALLIGNTGPALGDHPITLFGTDTFGNRGRADFTLVIQTRRIAVSMPASLAAYGATGLLPLIESDVPVVSYRYDNLPPGFSYQTATGRITPRSATGAPPTERTVTLTVTDTYGNTGTATFDLEVVTLTPDRTLPYVGLVDRHPSLNDNLGGTLALTPVFSRRQPTGAYTGSLTLGAVRYALSGRISSGGPGTDLGLSLIGKAKGRANLALEFTLPADLAASGFGTARAGNGAPVSLDAWPSLPLARPADYLGKHVFALFPPDEPATPAVPAGIGIGGLSVAKNGRAGWTATLADGTRLTGATPLGREGHLPLFARIAKPGGSLHGTVRLASGARTLDGELTWLRARAPAAAYAKTPLYRDGFGPLPLALLGGPIIPPPSGTRVLGPPDASPNVRLLFLDGGLGEQHLEQLALPPLTVTPKNTVVRPAKAPENPAALSLALKPSAATFHGSFVLRDPNPLKPGATVARKVAYQGVLLDGRGVGFFLLPGLKTDASVPPALSGAVILEPLPPAE